MSLKALVLEGIMANPEHLVMLKRGVEGWNRWRRVHVHPEVDLSGADLSDADLDRANLSGASLRYAV
jgi:hypothetical protein